MTFGRRVVLWGPVALWMGLIFFASSQRIPRPAAWLPDWVTHALVYAVLAALLCRALSAERRPLSLRTAALAVTLATAYGISDEWHQSFVPGRTPEVADVVKDLAGALLGAGLFRLRAARRQAPAPAAR